jgi:hypothetical protein
MGNLAAAWLRDLVGLVAYITQCSKTIGNFLDNSRPHAFELAKSTDSGNVKIQKCPVSTPFYFKPKACQSGFRPSVGCFET